MSYLRELLAVDHNAALEFFAAGLKDVSEIDVNIQELLYNASVLAHYAQVSTGSNTSFPTPVGLSNIFDTFVCGTNLVNDAEIAEIAGTQCLLLTGFFENQVNKRHSLRWYRDLGAEYFRRAAIMSHQAAKARLLSRMSASFEPWRQRYTKLSQSLRNSQIQ